MDAPKHIDIEADFVALSTAPTDAAEFAQEENISGYADDDDTDAQVQTIERLSRTANELRELQVLMLNACRDESNKASERAQCAKAYRDIEIVRRAIRGKPLALNATMRLDPPKRSASPMIVLGSDDDAKTA
jgi:hypothetical protein